MKKILFLISLFLIAATILCGCNANPDTPVDTDLPVTDYSYVTYTLDGVDYVTLTKYIGQATDVAIPAELDGMTVTEIGAECFAGTSVVSVTVPDSVIVIEYAAFSGCESLASITLPENMLYLGQQVFMNCTSLKEITLPATGITEYGWGMFLGSGLEKVSFREGMEVLPANMFLGCKLKEVALPSSVKTIQQGALGACENLTSITLSEGLTTVEAAAFMNNPSLTEIVIPASVETITEYAFVGCEALTKVKFEGNAPAFKNADEDLSAVYGGFEPKYTIYYHEGADGFTTPEWEGFPTEIW